MGRTPARARAARWFMWSWPDALRCAVCTLPAALVVAFGDPSRGLAWAVGILPAAVTGLAPTRKERRRLVAVGVLFALSVMVGSLLSQSAVTAVVGIFIVAYGAALLASWETFVLTAMILCAPVAAIGLSYPDLNKAAGLAVVMLLGSVFSYLVFLMWPESQPDVHKQQPALLPRAVANTYGVLSGIAASVSAAIGVAVHTDRVGWAPASALFVMRPSKEMQELRSIGRLVSVVLGAGAAVLFLRLGPTPVVVSIFAVLALAGAGALHESKWYVTPFFTMFIVLTMLLYSNATVAMEQWRFNERVGETAVGVGCAYFFGLVVPKLMALAKEKLGRSGSRPAVP